MTQHLVILDAKNIALPLNKEFEEIRKCINRALKGIKGETAINREATVLLVSILVVVGAAFADYGFDSYGEYFWADSNEIFGPAYSWIDGSGGTDLGAGDEYTWTVQLPFDLMFYGKLFPTGSDFRVTTNADCGFDYAGIGIYNNTDLPGSADPNGSICLFWEVLYNPSGDHLYVSETTYSGEKAWVISYVPSDSSVCTGEGRLQTIILETDGAHDSTIIHQYEDTIFGYEDGDSVEGVVVRYMDSDLLDPGVFNTARP